MDRVIAFTYECVARYNDIADHRQWPFKKLKQRRNFEVGARVDERVVDNLPATALETTYANAG